MPPDRPTTQSGLSVLARPGGAFAMVALDQRESLRTMLAEQAADEPVPDRALTRFKVEAARALSPHASAVLVDVAFGLEPILSSGALAPGRGLIVAADRLDQPPGGIVEGTSVDEAVFADPLTVERADAFKLLVIWRQARDAGRRAETVTAFLDGCRRLGRPGIVEGIVRPEPGKRLSPAEHAGLVLEAARELGSLGPDLYKAEVPTLGLAEDGAVTAAAQEMTEALPCPWVVLSNGVRPDRFDGAALAACRGGASGFLAGRAIWIESIAAEDRAAHLDLVAAPRLAALAARVDGVARPWSAVTAAG
ncbi:MAG TPA: aldolase [Clostridia bacterium]|nr:aldolase [Clostridia bacterium]